MKKTGQGCKKSIETSGTKGELETECKGLEQES